MGKKLLYLLLVLCMTGGANAATYDWTGLGDGTSWHDPLNWSTDSASWTWPNEEFGAGQEYINSDVAFINILNGNAVHRTDDDDLSVDGSNCVLTLNNGSTLTIDDDVWVADDAGLNGVVKVLGGSTFNVGYYLKVGDHGTGTLNVNDSTVNVDVDLRLGHYSSGIGTANISGNSTVNILRHLIIADYAGAEGHLNISDNSNITVGSKLYFNDDSGSGSYSTLVMNGGTLDVADNIYINDDAGSGSQAYFTLNDGTVTGGGSNNALPWVNDSTAHLTINNGLMDLNGPLSLGLSGGDTGQSRIFMNGGVLELEDLIFNMTDALVVFTGGAVRINNLAITEVGMQDLIDIGRIDVSGAPGYSIYTDGSYTVLIPEPVTMALIGLGSLLIVRRRRR